MENIDTMQKHKVQDLLAQGRVRQITKTDLQPGAIIGDGDRKRAPFLVLGLAP